MRNALPAPAVPGQFVDCLRIAHGAALDIAHDHLDQLRDCGALPSCSSARPTEVSYSQSSDS